MITAKELLARYMKAKDLSSDEIKRLKHVSSDDMHDASTFTGMSEMMSVLKASSDKIITIRPDYDADGVCSGILSLVAMKELGIGSQVFLNKPHANEGYGLTRKAVDAIMKEFPSTQIIFTTDNGINCKDAVDYALSRYQVSCIITDHHVGQAESFPDAALAVVNPNRQDKVETYPFHALSGTAVAWKVFLSYSSTYHPELIPVIERLLPFVGISTISDVMPPIDENRYFLRSTIEEMNSSNIVQHLSKIDSSRTLEFNQAMHGLAQLIVRSSSIFAHSDSSTETLSQLAQTIASTGGTFNIDYTTIGFTMAPLLNSPRRMTGDSRPAFDVFLTSDAASYVEYLFSVNDERKSETSKAAREAFKQLDESAASVVYSNPELKGGIAGLVAGRIANKLDTAAIALTHSVDDEGNEVLGGSARSVPGISLQRALSEIDKSHPEIFVGWGGHDQAAGLSIYAEYEKQFAQLFDEAIKSQHATRQVTVAKHVNLAGLDGSAEQIKEIRVFLSQLKSLEPIPNELVCTYELPVAHPVEYRYMGKLANHVNVSANGVKLIKWDGRHEFEEHGMSLSNEDQVFILNTLELNTFRGRTSIQGFIEAFGPQKHH